MQYDLGMSLWDWDWGDVPTWIAALFGGGAFLGALLLFRIEAQRDNRQEKADRAEQASLVTAWIRYRPDSDDDLQVHIQNASTACVYGVCVEFVASRRSLGYILRDVVPPYRTSELIIPIDRSVISSYYETVLSIAAVEWTGIEPILYFRDSANRFWKRERTGTLVDSGDASALPDTIRADENARSETELLEERARAERESNGGGA